MCQFATVALRFYKGRKTEEVMTAADLIEFDQSKSQSLLSPQEDIKIH